MSGQDICTTVRFLPLAFEFSQHRLMASYFQLLVLVSNGVQRFWIKRKSSFLSRRVHYRTITNSQTSRCSSLSLYFTTRWPSNPRGEGPRRDNRFESPRRIGRIGLIVLCKPSCQLDPYGFTLWFSIKTMVRVMMNKVLPMWWDEVGCECMSDIRSAPEINVCQLVPVWWTI